MLQAQWELDWFGGPGYGAVLWCGNVRTWVVSGVRGCAMSQSTLLRRGLAESQMSQVISLVIIKVIILILSIKLAFECKTTTLIAQKYAKINLI